MSEWKVESTDYGDWYDTLDTRKVFTGDIPVSSLGTHYITVTFKENYVEEPKAFKNNNRA
jgi:hypothetical protein